MLINVYPASDVRGCVMSNHVWGLLSHPAQEFRQIRQENESVSHIYTHHVLLMAAIPVVCSFIGATQFGWDGCWFNCLINMDFYQSLSTVRPL